MLTVQMAHRTRPTSERRSAWRTLAFLARTLVLACYLVVSATCRASTDVEPDIGEVAFEPLSSIVNETVPPETPVRVCLTSTVTDRSRIRLYANKQLVGKGLCHSLVLPQGSDTLRADLMSRDGSKVIDSESKVVLNPRDSIDLRLRPVRTDFFVDETLRVSDFPADTTNVRAYTLNGTYRYGPSTSSLALVTTTDGRLNQSLSPGSFILQHCLENTSRNLRVCREVTLTIRSRPPIDVRLYGLKADALAGISGTVYVFTSGNATAPSDSVSTGPDGKVSIAFPGKSFALAGRSLSGEYLPVFTRTIGTVSGELALILVSEQWKIAACQFAGNAVPISFNRAMEYAPGDENARIYRSFYGRAWNTDSGKTVYRSAHWKKADRPVPVAFDRGQSNAPITAQDSVAMWQALNNAWRNVFCIDMYRPATITSLPANTGVRVAIKTDQGSGYGEAFSPGNGFTGNLAFGYMQFNSTGQFATSTLIHESGHVAGFGHNCEWVTIMSRCILDATKRSETITKEDVAYVQVFYALKDAGNELTLPYDPIVAAIRGERCFKLRLSSCEHPAP